MISNANALFMFTYTISSWFPYHSVLVGSNSTTLRCSVSAGVGSNYVFALTPGSVPTFSVTGTDTLAYPAPVITGNTLRRNNVNNTLLPAMTSSASEGRYQVCPIESCRWVFPSIVGPKIINLEHVWHKFGLPMICNVGSKTQNWNMFVPMLHKFCPTTVGQWTNLLRSVRFANAVHVLKFQTVACDSYWPLCA